MIAHPLLLLTAALILVPTALPAQQEAEQRPAGWVSRFDRAGTPDSAVFFVAMPPGWHMTTGPAGIHYHPDRRARGTFRLEAEIFVFPETGAREAFGILFGGRDLDTPRQAYSYFLIRGDGSFLVKRRDGPNTRNVVAWTRHDVIAPRQVDIQARNVLAIEARSESVTFLVNDTEVATVPRAELVVDGIVGLRVNHNVNIHVTGLEIHRR